MKGHAFRGKQLPFNILSSLHCRSDTIGKNLFLYDGWMSCDLLLNRNSGRWEGDDERLCAIKKCQVKFIPKRAG